MYDILIKNAKLRKKDGFYDIAIEDSRIAEISKNITGHAKEVLDAEGNLVTESFVNPHLHLCKVYTLEKISQESLKSYHTEDMGEAMQAIEIASKVKENYSEDWILKNVERALEHALEYGTLHIRAFADVDSKAKLIGIKALLRAKELFRDRLHLEVVAFPQDGVVKEKDAFNLVEEALKLGADVVGGIPWIELTVEDEIAHVEKMFHLATKYNKPVSMLVDDAGDPGLRTLEILAKFTLKHRYEGKVLAHHARAMELYPKPYLLKVIELLKMSGISIVTDPHTGPLHVPVQELLRRGVNVALGQDDISDAYYPFGRNNMLEIAFLASHILWMTTLNDLETLYDMITKNGAKALNLKDYGLEEGKEANLVILKHDSVLDALRYHEKPSHVIFKGKLVKGD